MYKSRGISKTVIAIAIFLVLVIIVGGVYWYLLTRPAPPPVEIPEKIVIGGTLGISGKYTKEGTMSLYGILAAVKWVNEVHGGISLYGYKVPVEFKYYDDESKKEAVPSLYERLITVDKVHFLLAPYASSLTFAAAPVADKYGVVILSHGGASNKIFEQGYKYVVQVLSPATKYLTGVLDMVKDLDPTAKRVAIIYKEHEFSRTVAEGAKEYAEKLGFEVVFYASYPAGATDLTPILIDLAATKPDVIIGGGHFADGQLLASQLAELNINAKAIGILVAPALPAFYEALGGLSEGILYPAQWELGVKYSPEAAAKLGIEFWGPTQEEFLELFREITMEREGKELKPSYHAAEAAASLLVIAKAIEIAQSLDQDEVRKVLSEMDIMTFFGRFKIDPETGLQIGHEMVIGQWQNGKKAIVWPKEAAITNPIYPLPTWEEKKA